MPQASFRSYPKARISGMAIAPMVAAEATLDPQQAPNPAEAMKVAMPSPPGSLENHFRPME